MMVYLFIIMINRKLFVCIKQFVVLFILNDLKTIHTKCNNVFYKLLFKYIPI